MAKSKEDKRIERKIKNMEKRDRARNPPPKDIRGSKRGNRPGVKKGK